MIRSIGYIEAHGLEAEGIYRVSGKLSTVQNIVHSMEKEEEAFEFGPHEEVPAVAGVLKVRDCAVHIPGRRPLTLDSLGSFTCDNYPLRSSRSPPPSTFAPYAIALGAADSCEPYLSRSRGAFTAELATSPETALSNLSRRIGRLSSPQQATLRALCQHLYRVSQRESRNKMGPANLALIFTSVIFGDDDAAALEAAMHGSKVSLAAFSSEIFSLGGI